MRASSVSGLSEAAPQTFDVRTPRGDHRRPDRVLALDPRPRAGGPQTLRRDRIGLVATRPWPGLSGARLVASPDDSPTMTSASGPRFTGANLRPPAVAAIVGARRAERLTAAQLALAGVGAGPRHRRHPGTKRRTISSETPRPQTPTCPRTTSHVSRSAGAFPVSATTSRDEVGERVRRTADVRLAAEVENLLLRRRTPRRDPCRVPPGCVRETTVSNGLRRGGQCSIAALVAGASIRTTATSPPGVLWIQTDPADSGALREASCSARRSPFAQDASASRRHRLSRICRERRRQRSAWWSPVLIVVA